MFGDNVNLGWLAWNQSLPDGAVAVYNGYTERTDYVCKHQCEAGFYSPSLGPYCHYPYADRGYRAADFQVLVNKDNFEFLEWKEDSYGSVPQDSVRTCSGKNVFVGKNKFGLGKVVTQLAGTVPAGIPDEEGVPHSSGRRSPNNPGVVTIIDTLNVGEGQVSGSPCPFMLPCIVQ